MLIAVLVACHASSPEVRPPADDTGVSTTPPDDTAPTDSTDSTTTVPTDSTGTDSTPTDSTPPAPEFPEECSSIYDPDVLATVSLTFAEEDWAAMGRDCRNGAQEYRPVRVSWDGEEVDAMIRLKGNWSWSCDKYQWVISFNEVDPDARFHGLRKTIIDAPWYDQTFLHERMAFPLFAARGLPYSCVNNVRVEVNGEYYGLYANVEKPDREYLERHYPDPDGNLYQAGWELETNEETGDTTRRDALYAATTAAEIAALINVDETLAEWAMEAMVPAMDNYWAGVDINYYIYDNPDAGFEWLPYDLDISFGDAAYTSGDVIWPESATVDPITWQHSGWGKEALFMTLLSDPAMCARFVEEVAAARAVYDPDAMAVQLDAWADQIAAAAAEDRRKPFSTEAHTYSVAQLRAFFQERADHVDAWLAAGGQCPVRW